MHCQGTSAQVAEFTETFLAHYNSERPNQARSCGNQPPRVACQQFPVLPSVPETVDPDRWLVPIDKQAFARTIRVGGFFTVHPPTTYKSPTPDRQPGTCRGDAAAKQVCIRRP